jgi:choline dehydrogenase-like flavoprotein
MPARSTTFDGIVIGAGSVGCVLARRLSADANCSVLLRQAGGRDSNPLLRLPMLMGKLMHSGLYNWHYRTQPEPRLNDREIDWPRGKSLGGSSTINGMIYLRGNAHDDDRRAQMGNAAGRTTKFCRCSANRRHMSSGAARSTARSRRVSGAATSRSATAGAGAWPAPSGVQRCADPTCRCGERAADPDAIGHRRC